MMDEWLKKYEVKFDESFPLYCCVGLTALEVIKIIKECIQTNTPFNDGAVIFKVI